MLSKTIVLWFMTMSAVVNSFPFLGTWTDFHKSTMIKVCKEKIIGSTTDVDIEMDVVDVMNNNITTLHLHNIRVTRHPEWRTIWKFRSYKSMYHKIQENGIKCSVLPITDINHVLVLIDTHQFELFRTKNDFKSLDLK